jgi:hypothetical protein
MFDQKDLNVEETLLSAQYEVKQRIFDQQDQ